MAANILETKDLTVKFGGLVATNKVNIAVPEGKIIGIIGPNGAGKTTLFNLITGAVPATSGEILFRYEPPAPIEQKYIPPKRKHGQVNEAADASKHAQFTKRYQQRYRDEMDRYEKEIALLRSQNASVNLSGKNTDAIARLGLSRTFQNIRLYSKMTVLENVLTSIQAEPPYSILTAMLGLPEKYRRDRSDEALAMEYLEQLGIADTADATASSLPYGKQRRLEIARAIATRPRLLLLDEPAAGMNNEECRELVKLIRGIHQKLGITILLIEHHMDVIMNLSDEIYVITLGSVLRKGTPSEIQSDPEVIKAYLGEKRRGR